MAHAEYLVLEDRTDGTGDTIEISTHKTADKAIEECNTLHEETGKYYEVEYLLVEGGFGGNGKNRQILEVDDIYGIGEASWAQ